MCKKALTVILSGFICAFFTLVTTVKAAEFNLGDLGECKRIYSCGNRAAYFYGYTNTALISSRLSDDCRTSRVNINGVIRSVTHSGSFTYALFSVSNRQYSVIMLNADSGDYSIIDLNSDFEIDPKSIAADSSEIFVLSLSGIYRDVVSFDKNGQRRHTYSLPRGAALLFSNGETAYALSEAGGIYRLGGGKAELCANAAYNASISDAGQNSIYADGKLISLLNGSSVSCGTRLAAMGEKGVVTSDSGLLMTAADGRVYLLNSDYMCTELSYEEETAPLRKEHTRSGSDLILGAGTTVGQLKTMYPEIKTVYNKNGNAVTSGKLCTGYHADTLSVIIPGDVDGTGTVSSRDIKTLMRYQVGSCELTGVFLKAADFNLDGQVDNRDLVLMSAG